MQRLFLSLLLCAMFACGCGFNANAAAVISPTVRPYVSAELYVVDGDLYSTDWFLDKVVGSGFTGVVVSFHDLDISDTLASDSLAWWNAACGKRNLNLYVSPLMYGRDTQALAEYVTLPMFTQRGQTPSDLPCPYSDVYQESILSTYDYILAAAPLCEIVLDPEQYISPSCQVYRYMCFCPECVARWKAASGKAALPVTASELSLYRSVQEARAARLVPPTGGGVLQLEYQLVDAETMPTDTPSFYHGLSRATGTGLWTEATYQPGGWVDRLAKLRTWAGSVNRLHIGLWFEKWPDPIALRAKLQQINRARMHAWCYYANVIAGPTDPIWDKFAQVFTALPQK
jgi:hypothetical protein